MKYLNSLILVSALALGGCTSLEDLYPDCIQVGEQQVVSMDMECVEDAREYKRVETHNNYLMCQHAVSEAGLPWYTYVRGGDKRDRKTGIPHGTNDMRQDLAANGCRLWAK